MKTIANIVEDLFINDYEAQSAARNNYLDLVLYAKQIQPNVEARLNKNINLRTLTVTLGRIAKRNSDHMLIIKPKLTNISVYSELVEYTFEKSRANLKFISSLPAYIEKTPDKFFAITQSSNELTIICEKEIALLIKKGFPINPLFSAEDLVGISVKFPIQYLKQPNVIFEITRRLANKNINIIEIVSTTTELTFIVRKHDMEPVVLEMTALLN